jgi:hypothetical protein
LKRCPAWNTGPPSVKFPPPGLFPVMGGKTWHFSAILNSFEFLQRIFSLFDTVLDIRDIF